MSRRVKISRKRAVRRPAAKGRSLAASAAAPSRGFSRDSSADPLADARIRPLLEHYCALAGVKRAALGPDHAKLTLPKGERPFFRDRESLRVAFSLDALERDPDAEIAVLGSPFLSQLLEAIRSRAARLSLGMIAPAEAGSLKRIELTIPVRDGTAKAVKPRLAVHAVGRLVARVVLRAGAGVEETVVESDVFDLSAGAKVGADLAGAFEDLETGRAEPADPSVGGDAKRVPARAPAELLTLMLGHLREKSAERVAARRAAAEQGLSAELARLDRYFESILKEQGDAEAIGTVTALAERRRTEEIRRSQVKAVVHPLQLVEAAVVIERAEWRLESSPPRGRHAAFSAQRSVRSAGTAGWIMACPHCGRPPAELVICRHDHCGCDACASRCSVCAEDFCTEHGIAQCRVDGQPACDEHVRVCPSCRLEHCTAHEGVCTEDGHAACTACLAQCASCRRVVCNRHAEQSHAEAPKGSRRLCSTCLRHCEGGTGEAVGVDEVAQCATCGKSVCMSHQAVCAVDKQVHCAQHLRRTDASRRLVCVRHRADCALETTTLLASDEVEACASCGKLVCAAHSAECAADGARHCVTHLEALQDAGGAYACVEHRNHCHVDGAAFSPQGVAVCPVCARDACAAHRARCGYCGRQVCTADLHRQSRRCATCAQLAVIADPPDDVITAARGVTGGATKSPRVWRMARDRGHVVVEVDLGLRRRAVFTLPHGGASPDSVVRHSLLGSTPRR